MNEAALYALEHVDKTVEIHDAISDMEELVFKGFDSAVKESISDWFGDDWQCDESNNLRDGLIYLYYIDKAYIALAYGDSGSGNNIWTFLGKNSRSGGKDYSIWLATSNELPNPQNNNMFDMEKIKALKSHGFYKKQWRGNFWLTKTISFNNEDILKGLKSEGWEAALSPLKKAWQPLVELDWDEIYKIVNDTQG